jgi:hypothetical protein
MPLAAISKPSFRKEFGDFAEFSNPYASRLRPSFKSSNSAKRLMITEIIAEKELKD